MFSAKTKSKNKASSNIPFGSKSRLVFFVVVLLFFSLTYSTKLSKAQSTDPPPMYEPGNYMMDSTVNATGKSPTEIMGKGLDVVVSAPIIAILRLIAWFCKLFVFLAARVLDVTLDPTLYNFTGSDFIKIGWIVVRDVCNLFFLLVLLFIAICTILKIEKYHAKKTLLTLIIMALLINFSKPIATFIFDGSQLLMNFFLTQLTGNNQTASTMYSQASQIVQLVYSNQGFSLLGGSDIAIQLLFVIVFLFIYAVALFVVAIFLLIRIVAVMLLIIVSPFAFFAAIVPDFSKMSGKWWDALFKYSYYGPAAAFFLLLGTRLTTALPQFKVPGATSGEIGLTVQIMQYLSVLVFVYASIIMAQSFGIHFAGTVTGYGNRFMKWAGGMTKGGGMWGAGARATGLADVYKGTMAGLAKRPGWRVLTKQGREAIHKERQEEYEQKVAPFSLADAIKKSKDEEFKEQPKVDAGVAKGIPKDLITASKRGTLTEAQLENRAVLDIISKHPELRNEILKNLRAKGQVERAAYLRFLTRDQETDEAARNWSLNQFGEHEINRISKEKIGDMDWERVASVQNGAFRDILLQRLNNMARVDPQSFLNTISNLDGFKMNFIFNNPDFHGVITQAQESVRGRAPASEQPIIQVVRDSRPRERTVYDEQGRPT